MTYSDFKKCYDCLRSLSQLCGILASCLDDMDVADKQITDTILLDINYINWLSDGILTDILNPPGRDRTGERKQKDV